jgi:alkylhydroperoxidase family enzyme
MRLKNIERGQSLPHRLIFLVARLLSGYPMPDVVRTLMYRKQWFGTHISRLTHAVMRGPSEWPVGERELFAAFVSRVNQCPF